MVVLQLMKRVMTSAIDESNAWLLEKVRGPWRAMMETYNALEDGPSLLCCGDAKL